MRLQLTWAPAVDGQAQAAHARAPQVGGQRTGHRQGVGPVRPSGPSSVGRRSTRCRRPARPGPRPRWLPAVGWGCGGPVSGWSEWKAGPADVGERPLRSVEEAGHLRARSRPTRRTGPSLRPRGTSVVGRPARPSARTGLGRGTNGTTSTAPSRGWMPTWARRSMRATAEATTRRAASSTVSSGRRGSGPNGGARGRSGRRARWSRPRRRTASMIGLVPTLADVDDALGQ